MGKVHVMPEPQVQNFSHNNNNQKKRVPVPFFNPLKIFFKTVSGTAPGPASGTAAPV